MTILQLDTSRFVEEFLWRGEHFNLLADKDLEASLYACEKLNVEDEDDELYRVPADRLYQLPQPIVLFGHTATLVSEILGNIFLVFRGRLAKTFATELSLTFDEQEEIPRPSGLAGLLDIYIETAGGRYEVVSDDDIEQLVADGRVYDTVYYRDEEMPDGIIIKQRLLIAYESSRFPGFTLLGTQHAAQFTDESLVQFARIAEENARKLKLARAAIDAEINTSNDKEKSLALMRGSNSTEPGDAFLMRRRQRFLTEAHSETMIPFMRDWNTESKGYLADETLDNYMKSLQATTLRRNSYDLISLLYTSGHDLDDLTDDLEFLVNSYQQERTFEILSFGSPDVLSGFGENDDYEQFLQTLSLCILLGRGDLIPRLTAIFDRDNKGQDALYEFFASFYDNNRIKTDKLFFKRPFAGLLKIIRAATPKEAGKLLDKYCKNWYPAFKKAPWHDSHLDGDEGSYEGYWAFEAGAVAFLLNIDDSHIEHMVYPKDLVAYARALQPISNHPAPIHAGQPCSHAGYWFSPAWQGSRRYFKQGEVMTEFKDSAWGATILYWLGEDNA